MQPSNAESAPSAPTQQAGTQTQRNHTPIDALVRLLPFAAAFIVAVLGGTWYLQDTEAAQRQIQRWTGYRISGIEESADAPSDTNSTDIVTDLNKNKP
jgi:hypothetical protein